MTSYVIFFVCLWVSGCSDTVEDAGLSANTTESNTTESIELGKDSNSAFWYKPPDRILKQYEGYYIGGIVDDDFVRQISNIPAATTTILLTSPGGNSYAGLLAASLIKEKQYNIIVLGLCLSACSEYLLPASSSIKFEKMPLIGFHLNPIAKLELLSSKTENTESYCHFHHTLAVRKFMEQADVNSDFWKEQYERMGPENLELIEYGRCTDIKINTKYPMWFPTSQQLKEKFGLKFTGKVCADDPKCYKKRLNLIYQKGRSIAVSNTVYISEGSHKNR